MSEWSSMMDDIIDEAVSEGFFDNLPGKGKPLNLRSNPFSQDSELAFELLRYNEYTLPWIAERSQLMSEIERFREEIKAEWAEYHREYGAARSEAIQMSLKLGWGRQLNDWQERIKELNDRISKTNLKQPGEKLEIFKLNLENELVRADARRELD